MTNTNTITNIITNTLRVAARRTIHTIDSEAAVHTQLNIWSMELSAGLDMADVLEPISQEEELSIYQATTEIEDSWISEPIY